MSEPKIRLTQISPSATGTDSISGNVTITNDLTVGGNLTVSGDTTTLNVQTLLVEDNEIILNSNVTGSPSLNASVTINRGSSSNAFLLWNEGTDKWGWSDDGNTVTEFATAVLKTGDTMTGNLIIDGANLNVNGLAIFYGNDPDLIQNMYSNSSAEVIAHEFRVDNVAAAQLSYHRITNETTLYGANANSILQLGAGGKANVIYITNTANVVIADQNNRVVIGSTTPGGDAVFSVVSDDFTGLGGEVFLGEFCPANTDGSVAIGYFANGVTDLYGFIRSRHSVDLGLGAGAANHVYIKQGGNVGIGTTSPLQTLHVQGHIFTPSSIYLSSGSNTRLSGSGSGELGLNFNTVGTSDFHLRVYDVGAPANGNAVFQVARTTGNTKIGFDPTNPNLVAANLHVQTNDDRAFHIDGPISGPVYLSAVNNNIGPYDLRELGLRGDPVTIYTGSGAKSNGTLKFLVNSGGNVGIGTTVPAARLHVRESGITAAAISTGWPAFNAEVAAQSKYVLDLDAGGNGDVATGGTGASATLIIGNYYDARGIITMRGAGGASPSDQGQGYGKDLMVKAGNSDNGNGLIGGRLFLAGGSGYSGGSFNTNYGAVVLQPQGGNVGIGTTSPTLPLQVNGIEVSAKFVGSQAGYTQGAIVSHSGTDSSPDARGQGMFLFNEGNDTTWYIGTNYVSADTFSINRRGSTASLDSSTAQLTYSLFTISNSGAVSVPGSLSKGSGSFKIDHPLLEKSNTHHLVHSFIEGPQADLIYSGRVQLENGLATVNIDAHSNMTEGTFVALCRDIRCFTTNETDWDAIRGSVSGNILTIECQNPSSNAMVSWMVIGERQDKHMYDTGWTDENGRVIVEPEKETLNT
jgi:hypothetical protein